MYVRRKGWAVESITAQVSHQRVPVEQKVPSEGPPPLEELIRVEVTVRGKLDEEQKARLLDIVKRCPVHRTLSTPPRFEETLTVVS
ncbi:MAG: OsmC family protein [Dehalococcoidia bacterium]|nr:OsmC family protein [Dehalococcoidia bacterium]